MAPGGELPEMIRMLGFQLIATAGSGDDTRIFSFGPDAGTGEVDGTIDCKFAVEIGMGGPNQIRPSVLFLALYPYPVKLLILVDAPTRSTGRAVGHEFTLIVEGPDLQEEAVIHALFKAGLDDATVGRAGTLQYVDVDRESEDSLRRCSRQPKPSSRLSAMLA